MQSAPIAPTPRAVSEVGIKDDSLVWTESTKTGQLKLAQVIFTLPLQSSGEAESEFVIAALEEQPDDAENPFELVLLATKHLPEALKPLLLSGIPSHLQHNDENEANVIVSTKSGLNKALPFWQRILQPLWALLSDPSAKTGSVGKPYNLLITESAQDVPRFAQELWKVETSTGSSKPRTIVLLSGDGGVVDLLNGSDEFPREAAPLRVAILPLGTGNALFHSTHKPLYSSTSSSPLVLGLRTLFNGTSAPLPIYSASFSPGSSIVNFTEKANAKNSSTDGESQFSKQEEHVSHLYGAIVASYGFHSSLIFESDTPEYRVHGDKRFGMVAQDLLKDPHAYAASVTVTRPGGQPELISHEKHGYVLSTPLSNLERTFTISPASRPLDGKLRLVYFGPLDGKQVMDIMMAAYADGKHIENEHVRYEEVQEIKVEMKEDNERWRNVCIDGTSIEVPQGGHMIVKNMSSGPWQVMVDASLLSK